MTILRDYLILLLLAEFLPSADPVPHRLPAAPAIPGWSAAAGDDRYGRWADLVVAGIHQRLRWIAPGTFIMGCPQAEQEDAIRAGARPEWVADEMPHRVTLTRGFWLADSPCTQELWQAVMGSNPARFQGDPRRPVESVSFEEAQWFLAALNGLAQSPLQPAHRGAAGIRLPGRDPGRLCRCGAGALGVVPRQQRRASPPGAAQRAEFLGALRHARQCLGMVRGLVCCLPIRGGVRPPWTGCGYLPRPARRQVWSSDAGSCRSAYRGGDVPTVRSDALGFRFGAPAEPAAVGEPSATGIAVVDGSVLDAGPLRTRP